MKINSLIILTLSLLLFSCNYFKDNEMKDNEPITRGQARNPLIEANKHMVNAEDEAIRNFIKRYQWKMQESGTGLRYMIYAKTEGLQARSGLLATINYSIKLINGDECYSSEVLGAKEFLIGKDNVEEGLHEGILLMRVGEKAKFIIPSHLAFGLVGDSKKIPARATLIYDIELISVKQK